MSPAVSAEVWIRFIDHVESAHKETLTPWETEFLDSVRQQLVLRRTLSRKQEPVLKDMQARCQCQTLD